ncbi:MAG: nuclear transport factor 2 family protein [Bacteroidetes bacterium]|nr:nuclear transport factor 2 family protein [Bacteroidota bacterium]MBU1373359.1 nuclear transport factor 2 family protein [Bacteroidota bacterium]MBU1484450.1 nuclear transport factor 2 family protein [Bacteroidota bacterium]MBU1760888.1 nuclear transport factor 2 family protein [Bacteroidota bacterium]MBU2269008.1 nuclear transport factor 2 family protein [Bacteroidota bacterium]
MDNQTITRQLLEIYYKGFAEKANWESVIGDDFEYVGGDMNNIKPVVGKQAYIEIIKRFSQRFEVMKVKQMIVEGDKASVIGNYDFVFPNGFKINGNVSENWTVKNGKLHSLTLYFDTLTFMTSLKP